MRPLMHGIDRYESRRIADRQRRHTPHRRLRMAGMVDGGIIPHDLPPSAQRAPAVGLAFHEAIEDAALEVFRPPPLPPLQPGGANGIADAIDIKRVAHDGMVKPITAA